MLTPSILLQAVVSSCRLALPTGTVMLTSSDPPPPPAVPTTWCEVWVDHWSAPPHRTLSPLRPIELSIIANAFGRPPGLSSSVQELAELLRRHLTQLSLPVADDLGETAFLRLTEADLRDLSRPATSRSAGLTQWTVSVRGSLQLTPATSTLSSNT